MDAKWKGTRKSITHFQQNVGVSLAGLKLLVRRRGRFRPIRLFDHPDLGKVLVLGNEIQHVEAWAPVYHEPLIHLPSSFLRSLNSVLILGGGTLYAAVEALKYKSVRRVVLIDHEPSVTKLVLQHYQHAKVCLADPRFVLINGDAYKLLRNMNERFDLVINDGADLLEIGNQCIQKSDSIKSAFEIMSGVLQPEGVCADFVFRHVFERRRTIRTINHLRRQYRYALSLVLLPEYHGVLHVLTVWGKNTSKVAQKCRIPVNEEQKQWVKLPSSNPCSYYDPRFLPYYLYLPRYLLDALEVKENYP